MQKYFFQDVARAERYFTATLLPHLLMINNFEGVKILFRHVYNDNNLSEPDDFEIVTELDPVRDGSVYNDDVRKIYKELGRIAVPDLFIRWGKRILAIEAKFFTEPTSDELQDQLKLQWDALSAIIAQTNYDPSNIQQCLLLINAPKDKLSPNIIILTWDEVVGLFDKYSTNLHITDCYQVLSILKGSIARARMELQRASEVTYTKVSNIEELIILLPKLIESKKVWVGFSEGISLDEIDLDYLLHRSHYRVSNKKHSPNWIRIDELIAKYISLKTK
ncbi:MAG: hypothetical protein KA096_00015 [Bacteroidales bacterium]|nr:hypothetical protein [Bacteroidales bacterium]